MVDTKTDSSSTPLSDDPVIPTKGLSAKPITASYPAGAEPGLDTLFHRTSRDSTARQNMLSVSEVCYPPAAPASGRVARVVAHPGPLRTEQGDFHHSALPLRSLTGLGPRSGRRSGVEGAGAP